MKIWKRDFWKRELKHSFKYSGPQYFLLGKIDYEKLQLIVVLMTIPLILNVFFNTSWSKVERLVLGIGGVLIIFFYFIDKQKYSLNKLAIKSFAKKYNLTFLENYDIALKEKTCQLLTTGYGMIFNYVKGVYNNREIEVYNYQHTFGGKSSATYKYTVFEIKTKAYLPHTIIANDTSYLLNFFETIRAPINLMKCDKFETESNEFNNLFKIFLKKDHTNDDEIRLLEILSPDIMEKMIKEEKRDNDKDINIEFNNDVVVLYKDDFVKNEEDIESPLNLTITIAQSAEK